MCWQLLHRSCVALCSSVVAPPYVAFFGTAGIPTSIYDTCADTFMPGFLYVAVHHAGTSIFLLRVYGGAWMVRFEFVLGLSLTWVRFMRCTVLHRLIRAHFWRNVGVQTHTAWGKMRPAADNLSLYQLLLLVPVPPKLSCPRFLQCFRESRLADAGVRKTGRKI